MFTRKVRNILIALVLVLSVGFVPAVGAEIVIEPGGVIPGLEIVIEPGGVIPGLEIVIEPGGVCREIVIEPGGVASRPI